jgi:hypothetical protein
VQTVIHHQSLSTLFASAISQLLSGIGAKIGLKVLATAHFLKGAYFLKAARPTEKSKLKYKNTLTGSTLLEVSNQTNDHLKTLISQK